MRNRKRFTHKIALGIFSVSFVPGVLVSAEAQVEVCRVVDEQLKCEPPPEDDPGASTASADDSEFDAEMAVDPSDLRQQMEAIIEEVGPGTARDMIDNIEGEM